MATELNLDVIRGMGFEVPEGSPNDLSSPCAADEAGIAAALAVSRRR